VRSWINHGTEIVEGPSPSLVWQLVEAGQPFWLDVENPTDEIIDQLAAGLGLHPLAVEDSKQFGQRGKLQFYGNVAMMVGFGLDPQMHEPVDEKGWPAFLTLSVGLTVACILVTTFLLSRRRWT
jgi:magnesium transporter